jgi:hypothetical protein
VGLFQVVVDGRSHLQAYVECGDCVICVQKHW